MPKYIDTMDAITELKKDFDGDECLKAIRAIQRAMAADVQAVNHGKWLNLMLDMEICSVCEHFNPLGHVHTRYCSYCGARMDL